MIKNRTRMESVLNEAPAMTGITGKEFDQALALLTNGVGK